MEHALTALRIFETIQDKKGLLDTYGMMGLTYLNLKDQTKEEGIKKREISIELISKLVLAVVVAVVVILGCILVGGLLIAVNVSVAVVVGGFLKTYATAIGILSGLWYFFTH